MTTASDRQPFRLERIPWSELDADPTLAAGPPNITARIGPVSVPITDGAGQYAAPPHQIDAMLTEAYGKYYPLLTYGPYWVTDRGGLCPLCCRFFSINRSRIVKLSEGALVHITYSKSWMRGQEMGPNGYRITVPSTRRYAHHRCARKMTGGTHWGSR